MLNYSFSRMFTQWVTLIPYLYYKLVWLNWGFLLFQYYNVGVEDLKEASK